MDKREMEILSKGSGQKGTVRTVSSKLVYLGGVGMMEEYNECMQSLKKLVKSWQNDLFMS